MDNPCGPTVAAIVPAHNAKTYIERCLQGLLGAGFSEREIVLVDDASTDQTATVARMLGIEPLVLASNAGAAEARNIGACTSDADILFFVDADVVVHSDARAKVLAFFKDNPCPSSDNLRQLAL